jgi:hypothetical protein
MNDQYIISIIILIELICIIAYIIRIIIGVINKFSWQYDSFLDYVFDLRGLSAFCLVSFIFIFLNTLILILIGATYIDKLIFNN